jgi:ankyrin repeat protein
MKRFALLATWLFALNVTGFAQESLADRIQAGDRKAALEMIRARANVNAPQPDGSTPLHWAVYRVDVELVEQLLARGAKADVVNKYGSSPLAEAIKVADTRLIEMLVKAGANVNAANEDGQTPLMLAARTGEVKVAELLVRHGADVNVKEEWRSQTALMWAAAQNHADMVEFLVRNGAKVNARGEDNDWPSQITSEPRAQYRPTGGLTPLLFASRAGCRRCVDALIKGGADPNLPNPDGMTPLMLAIDNLNFDVARTLLEQGANPHVWDWWGRTALYTVVDMRGRGGDRPVRPGETSSLDIVRMLLAAGVNPNSQLNMHRPSRGGNTGRFRDDLLTTGATPLLRAAYSFDAEVIRLLLDHGALVDLPNVNGVTPFMAAAGVDAGRGGSDLFSDGLIDAETEKRAVAALGILLKAGADVNARVTDTTSYTARIARGSAMTDRQGQTAIFGAAQGRRAAVVKFLLENGAKVDVVDEKGRTPLAAAKGNAGGKGGSSSAEVVALIEAATQAK